MPSREMYDVLPFSAYRDLITSNVIGSLVLDSKGLIRSCSTVVARLAGTTESELIGRAVKALLPRLPLSSGTQGYNVAFVKFLSAPGDVHALMLARTDGAQVPVEASISLRKVNKEYLFCLELYCRSEAGADDE